MRDRQLSPSVYLTLKRQSSQKQSFCHHLFTLVSFKSVWLSFFLLLNTLWRTLDSTDFHTDWDTAGILIHSCRKHHTNSIVWNILKKTSGRVPDDPVFETEQMVCFLSAFSSDRKRDTTCCWRGWSLNYWRVRTLYLKSSASSIIHHPNQIKVHSKHTQSLQRKVKITSRRTRETGGQVKPVYFNSPYL